MLWVIRILLSCGAWANDENVGDRKRVRFTKIKKGAEGACVHRWKDLKDRGDDRSDNVGG